MTRKHVALMVIGCLVPIALFAASVVLQIKLSTAVTFAIFLICPAMHLFMMKGHLGRGPTHDEGVTTRKMWPEEANR